VRLAVLLVLVACSRGASPPPPPAPPPAAPAIGDAPATAGDAPSAPVADAPATPPAADAPAAPARGPDASTRQRALPAVTDRCSSAADCTITSDELVDAPPRTYACCVGCTQRAVSTASLKAFHAACEKQPAPMCPPIGCVQPIVHAACDAGHCVVKPGA